MKKIIIFVNILFLFGCSNSNYDNGTNLKTSKIQKISIDNGINKNISTETFFDDGTNNQKIVLNKIKKDTTQNSKKKTKKEKLVVIKDTPKPKPIEKAPVTIKTEPKKNIKKDIVAKKEIVKTTSPSKLILKDKSFYYPLDKVNIREDFNDNNKGLTFKVDKNVAVFPAAKGMVIFSGNKNGIGKTLFIYHNDGYISIYYNLKTLNVTKGDYIKNLDSSIAYADTSFHFELRKQTKKGIESLNPKKLLQKRRK